MNSAYRIPRLAIFVAFALFAWPRLTGMATGQEMGGLTRSFHAVYELVAPPEKVAGNVFDGALSGDGQRVVLFSWEPEARKAHLYRYEVDERQLHEIPMPVDCTRVELLTINHDGSRAFFLSREHRFIYKLEGGRVTTILDARDHDEVNGCYNPRTTAVGDWVYFNEDRDDLWRVAHSGGKPERIVADESVPRDRGTGAHLAEFDISADGGTIAFVINGYRPEGGGWAKKPEVFVRRDGSVRQVTNDSRRVNKLRLAMSGDGGTIVYASAGDGDDFAWFAADTREGEPRRLQRLDYDTARPCLTADGSRAIYRDAKSQGGRLMWTDGSRVLNLFPRWNVAAITLAAHPPHLWISADGSRLLFRQGKELYIGHLNPKQPIPGAPTIGPARLDLADPPEKEPKNRLRFTARMGGEPAARDSCEILVDGRIQRAADELAMRLPHGLNDAGSPPDIQADDGIHSTWAFLEDKPEVAKRGAIRVAAETKDQIVTVADYHLVGGGAPPDHRPPFDPDKVVYDPGVGCDLIDDEVLVTVYQDVRQAQLERALDGFDFETKILDTVPRLNLYKIGVPKARRVEARERLAVHPLVGAAGYNTLWEMTLVFNDPVFEIADQDDWGLRKINAPQAWDITTGGAPMAIIDSGCDLSHEELAGKTINPFSYATNSGRMQCGPVQVRVKRELRTQWICAHGTHVAVTAGGIADNRAGTAGVAPRSPVMPIQYLYYYPRRQSITNTTFGANVAIERALAAGVQVMNLSFGRSISDDLMTEWKNPATRAQAEQKIFRQVDLWLEPLKGCLDAAHRQRVIICKAAGNDKVPARFDAIAYSRRAITVAATDESDARCGFSNYGDYTTVSAPGMNIYSATSAPDQYVLLNGTSMATPHVTGIVALMKTLKLDLTFEEARDILISTGRPLSTDQPIGPLVDARAALDELQRRIAENVPPPDPLPPLIPQPPTPPPAPVPPGDVLSDPAPWNHPEVQRLIDEWLARAIPKKDPATGPWFFDKYGRLLNNKTIFATQPPDYAAYRHKFLWGLAKQFYSTNLGTMYDYVVKNLKGR